MLAMRAPAALQVGKVDLASHHRESVERVDDLDEHGIPAGCDHAQVEGFVEVDDAALLRETRARLRNDRIEMLQIGGVAIPPRALAMNGARDDLFDGVCDGPLTDHHG